MTDALIGYTGFIGGAILRHHAFDALYRSTNIDDIRGRDFDFVVCSGVSAEKWRANRDPQGDRARIATLTSALEAVTAKRLVLISTVDVYPVPSGVDERSLIDNTQNAAYGRHRYELEEFCRARFDTTVVRLPGMFGRGLKKNVIYDLLHGLPVDGVPANARFQYYDVDRVWGDLDRILGARVAVANITSEPVVIGDVVQDVFGHTLPLAFAPSAANYDVRSIHAGLAGGSDGYWYDAATVMSGLRSFVADERAR